MDLGELQAACLDRPGAYEDHPFGPGALVVKVRSRMFALLAEDSKPLTISLKCEPDLATHLRRTHPGVAPGYHLDKRHWNTVTLDGAIDDGLVLEWLDDSYDLVVAKLTRKERDGLAAEG